MTSPEEGWERARSLFEVAQTLPVGDRDAYLDAACDDSAQRAEIAALLRAHAALEAGAAAGFLELDPLRAAALLESTESAPPPPDALMPGERLGRYRVVRRLGQGGMGVVYLAEDERLHRPAALKLLPRHLAIDAAARRRFEEEARAASALDHSNIVTVYELGDTPDGRLFLAMAYCEGETLRDTLGQGRLDVATALSLGSQIADGLGAAHRRGIVHRDINPRNIMVTGDGVAKIVDFGIAKMVGSAPADSAATPGTVAYMSPEQTRGEASDARADVWALGAVLYEMLAGRRPFADGDQRALIHAIRNEAPPALATLRTDVPEPLSRIVERCLSKQPAERYPNAGAVLSALQATTRPQRPRAAFTRAAAVVVLAGAIVLGWRASAATPRLEPRRVAIGDIENRSGAAQLDVHASMATDWITHGLWQTGFIEVVPLAAFADEPDAASPRLLARRSGAGLLVTGALYGDGDQVQLQAQVTDVASGRVVGSVEPVGTTVTTAMDGVEELRRRVQEALYPRLDTQLTHVQAVTRAPRFEAYAEYLAGRDAHAGRQLSAALDHFRRASALDPDFALPRVIAAVVLNMRGDVAAADSAARALEQHRAQLDRFSLAHLDWLSATLAGDQHAAHAAMDVAARLAPGSTLPGVQAADEALRLGRSREALDRLTAIEPERGELRGWLLYWQTLAAAHHLRGSHRRELAEAQRAREYHPDDARAHMLELQALAALGRTKSIERQLGDIVAATATAWAEPSPGALLLHTALELRAHAEGLRSRARRAAADATLRRAIAWYSDVPPAQRTVRQRYELTMALAAANRRTEARSLLTELVRSPPTAMPGPSPFAPGRTPNYPDPVAWHGALGVLAALDDDHAAAEAELDWLEQFDDPFARGRPTYWRAAITGAQGHPEEAVRLLWQAFEEGLPRSHSLHAAPELESLRGFAPFHALLRAS